MPFQDAGTRAPLPPGFTLFPLGIVRLWDCRLRPLLLFGPVFSVLVFQRSILANTGHLHSLFVCFYFLKDIFFSGYDSIKMNT